MSIIVNIYYTGENGNARKFAEEMEQRGIVDRIKKEDGNLGYDYYVPIGNPETIVLIDKWKEQEDLDFHHKTKMMREIEELREKYKLKMIVRRFTEYKKEE